MSSTVLVFRWLSLANLPVALLFRALGWRVIYIEPVDRLRTIPWTQRLGKLGLEWVNFAAYAGYIMNADLRVAQTYSTAMVENAFSDRDIDVLCGLNDAVPGGRAKAKALLFSVLASDLTPYTKTYALAEYFSVRGARAYIFQSRSGISPLLARAKATAVLNLCPFRRFPMGVVSRILKLPVALARRIARTARGGACEGPAQFTPVMEAHQEHQVLYFPHKGLSYGGLFLKDQYYSDDPKSPFHQSNITHLELGWMLNAKDRAAVSADYVRRGVDVDFIDLPRTSIHQIIRYVLSAYRRLSGEPGALMKAIQFARITNRIELSRQALSRYKGAHLALLGYDLLFPKTAVMALQSLGVKVIAVQERFPSAFYQTMGPLMDEYYVHGDAAKRLIGDFPYAHVDRLCVTGDHRVGRITEHAQVAQRERADRFGAYKTVCLALDFHSEPDPFENAMLTANNWTNNKLFYGAVARLADANPECMFVVRGKNNDWLGIPEMSDAADLIRARSNIMIDDCFDGLDRAYVLAAMADIVVARYTSMCDQCLAAGIPVLVVDQWANGAHGISEWHDYKPYPIMTFDEETLLTRFRETIELGRYMDGALFAQLRRDYYGVTPDNTDNPGKLAEARLMGRLQSAMDSAT